MGAWGGPGNDSETTFRADTGKVLSRWAAQLASSPETAAQTAQATTIGREAGALRAIAYAKHWWDLQDGFARIEQAAATSPAALAELLQSMIPAGSGLAAAAPAAARPPGADATRLIPGPRATPPTQPPPDGADGPPRTVRLPGGLTPPGGTQFLPMPGGPPRAAKAPLADTIVRPSPADGAPKAPGNAASSAATSPSATPQPSGSVFGFRAFGAKSSTTTPRPAAGLSLGAAPYRPGQPGAGSLRGAGRDDRAGRTSRSVTTGRRRAPGGGASGQGPKMLAGLLALATASAAIVVGVVLWRHRQQPDARDAGAGQPVTLTGGTLGSKATGAADAGATAASGAMFDAPATDPSQHANPLGDLSDQVQKVGKTSPELKALLDLQGQLAARCLEDGTTCGHGWTPFSREAIDPPIDAGVVAHHRSDGRSDGPVGAWLHALKIPHDFPVHDDPRIKGFFDYNAKNIAGRQHFQDCLFACAAYADIFEGALVKYGAPMWLIGVVYQESGCQPFATSQVGAKGLWQFMPESARAYGLKVVDGEIDERLNPIKSTDAAIRLLSDLARQLGAWDLALAGYNMGPYGLASRIVRAGGNVGYWDLVDADLLPEETEGYVPAIEAYALILENLARLDFSRDGKRLEPTAEIIVKPGARMSLLARAAHTSTLRIRELNPEFLRNEVPFSETTARVPDSEAHRAQLFLETLPASDTRDTCVPDDFDWGAKVFENSKYAAACHADGGAP